MILSKEAQISLNVIRERVIRHQTDFKTTIERGHVQIVADEIQMNVNPKRVKPIDWSCSACVLTQVHVIHNYIMFHEPKEEEVVEVKPTKTRKAKVTKVQNPRTKQENNGRKNNKKDIQEEN